MGPHLSKQNKSMCILTCSRCFERCVLDQTDSESNPSAFLPLLQVFGNLLPYEGEVHVDGESGAEHRDSHLGRSARAQCVPSVHQS